MKFGIADLATIPVRHQPSHKAEMVSQLVYGETYLVLDQAAECTQIECAYDGYTGWIAHSQFHEISEDEFRELKHAPPILLAEPLGWLEMDGIRRWIPAGSLLNRLEGRSHRLEAEVFKRPLEFNEKNLLCVTSMYLHTPYLWGGRTPFGIDCSGFAQMTYRYFGRKLLRDAYQQAEQGAQISRLADAQVGDLAFFEEEGRITHVGIVLAENKIIHAAGRVKICSLDEKGIFDAEAQRYSHYLERIRRF